MKNIKKYFHKKKKNISFKSLSVTIIRILTNERTFLFIYLFIFLTVRGGHLSNVRPDSMNEYQDS
jgi:hypothetical protein